MKSTRLCFYREHNRGVPTKRGRQRSERRTFVARILYERDQCEAKVEGICQKIPVHVHEKLTRARGGDILDPENVLAVCFTCHVWIHDHPKEAEARGLLLKEWQQRMKL